MPIILDSVSFSYGDRQILSDFSLSIPDGGRVCLSGPSGCGKTTVGRLVLGLLTPSSGSISVPERVSAVFQEDRLFKAAGALRQISAVGSEQGASELLREAGLEGIAHMRTAQLSGGMKRRLAILRALNFDSSALLLDEPFNGLDSDNRALMSRMILERFGDKPILMISHNPEDAALLGAELIRM